MITIHYYKYSVEVDSWFSIVYIYSLIEVMPKFCNINDGCSLLLVIVVVVAFLP